MSLKPIVYAAMPIAWDLGEAKNGSDQVAVVFQIIEHPTDAGRTTTWYGSFTDNSAKRTLESLRYCGLQGDDLIKMEGMGSRKVRIDMERDTYEGKTRLKVAWVTRYDTGGVKLNKVMEDKSRRGFAAKYKQLLAAMAALPPLPTDDTSRPKFDKEPQDSDDYYQDDPGPAEGGAPTF